MSLETIINAGKVEGKIQKELSAFKEDSTVNLVKKLVDIEGTADYMRIFNLTPERIAALHATQQRAIGDVAYKASRDSLIEHVQEDNNYRLVIDALGEGDEGLLNLAALTAGFKPVEYNGVNKVAYEAHKKAHKFVSLLDKPEKAFKEVVAELEKKSKIGKSKKVSVLARALAQLGNNDVINAVRGFANYRISQFADALGKPEVAREYTTRLYEHSEDEAKASMAYGLGKAITEAAE